MKQRSLFAAAWSLIAGLGVTFKIFFRPTVTIQYPRVPGHEVGGVIDSVGQGVAGWKVGQRVGVGWHGGHCGYCDSCRRGDFVTCQVAPQVPGIAYDGGYAEYMIAPDERQGALSRRSHDGALGG